MPFAADDWLFFEFSLALELKITVSELRQRMSGAEFLEWQAFFAERNERQDQASRKSARAESRKQLTKRRVGAFGG